jgi:LruC domain-containing protein
MVIYEHYILTAMEKKTNNSTITLIIAMIVILIVGTYGCRTNTTTPSSKSSFVDLEIREDFKFTTTRELSIHIEVITNNPEEATRKFSIYNGNPEQSGKLIISGITDPYNSFKTEIKIPSNLDKLYITSKDVNNQIETAIVDATGNDIYYSFDTGTNKIASFKSTTALYTDPGCGSCDEIISSGTYNKIDIDNNKIYCIEAGSNVTVTNKVNFKGGNLYICGNLTTAKIQASNSGGDFVVSAGGTLALSSGNIDKDLDNFINFGIASISGQTTIKDMNFENQGIMNISGGVNIQTEDFHNSVTMNISGHFNNNEEGINSGTMTVSGHFNNNGNSEFTNQCKLIITGNFNQNNDFDNQDNAYVQVGQTTSLSGSSETNMGVQSLISTANIHINNEINGPSVSCARIDVSNTTNINGSGEITGHIDICDADGIENNNGTVGSDVTFDCSCFIPTTSCNPGSGTPPNPDTDGDGCPDDQDEYPTDPDRCSNDYYPNETDFTSLAFEDLWTNYGDYDFNDLVLQTNYKIVKNAQNEIVEIYGKFHIAAVGASMNNGFGIEFDIPTSAVESVTGIQIDGSAVSIKANGIEDGPLNNAVMIVYDAINDYLGSAMVNTIPGGNSMEIDTILIHMKFTEPQASIGTPPYNPFMILSQNRGKELHKIDNVPTELVNSSFFGEGEDDSDPLTGRYYVSSTNLPWVIEIPANFEWPKENSDILSAYLKFQEWAESSGQLYPDWYEDDPGYRNDDNIY